MVTTADMKCLLLISLTCKPRRKECRDHEH